LLLSYKDYKGLASLSAIAGLYLLAVAAKQIKVIKFAPRDSTPFDRLAIGYESWAIISGGLSLLMGLVYLAMRSTVVVKDRVVGVEERRSSVPV